MRCFGYSRWKLDMCFLATGYLTQIWNVKILTPLSSIYDGSHYRTLLLQSQAGASALRRKSHYLPFWADYPLPWLGSITANYHWAEAEDGECCNYDDFHFVANFHRAVCDHTSNHYVVLQCIYSNHKEWRTTVVCLRLRSCSPHRPIQQDLFGDN